MTVTLDLAPDVEALIEDEAARARQSGENVSVADVAAAWLAEAARNTRRQRMQEALRLADELRARWEKEGVSFEGMSGADLVNEVRDARMRELTGETREDD